MKKLVMKLELLHDEKHKKKAMKIVSGISGVNSVAIDMKEKKMTVIGDVDVVKIANKLKKVCHVELLTVGEDKKEDKKEAENKKDQLKEIEEAYRRLQYLYAPPPYYYHVVSEDYPPNCVIC